MENMPVDVRGKKVLIIFIQTWILLLETIRINTQLIGSSEDTRLLATSRVQFQFLE